MKDSQGALYRAPLFFGSRLHPREVGEFRTAVVTVRTEQNQAKAEGRQPATCMPDKVGFSPNAILVRFNTIPQARRNMSVTQALREWMAHDYPAPNWPLRNFRSPTGRPNCPRSRRRPRLTQGAVRSKSVNR